MGHMGDRLREDKQSRYVNSHLGQLSLPFLWGTVRKSSTSLSCWGYGRVCSTMLCSLVLGDRKHCVIHTASDTHSSETTCSGELYHLTFNL